MPEPTLRDVAELAKVHPGTASRALNPETRNLVNAQTVQRVLNAARRLGYRPNPMARALKTNRTRTVGMLIPDLTNPLFPPIVRGVEDVLEEAGYTTLLANTDNDAAREEEVFNRLQARQVDGFLIATAYRNDAFLKEAHKKNIPLVLINRVVDNVNIPAVIGDDLNGNREVVSHLISLGHREIGYIAGPVKTSTGQARRQAFLFSAQEAGLSIGKSHVIEAERFSAEAGYKAANALLTTQSDLTAIVCGNDMIALGAFDAIAERGLSCPSDISVVGYNDMPFLDRLNPSLTSVRVSHHDTGAEAARLLLRRLGNPDATVTTVTLPTSLVIRQSTGSAKNSRAAELT